MPYHKLSSNKLPNAFWVCLGIALLPIGAGIGILLFKSSNLQFESDRGYALTIDTASKIKRASNDSEYANKVLLAEINDLKSKIDLIVETDRPSDPVLQAVKSELEQLQPVVKEVENYSNKLSEIVDNEIGESSLVVP